MQRSIKLTLTAIFGALATILSLMKMEIPFPILIYLKIDFAEIPVFLTYLLCNTRYAIAASTLHFLGLFLRSGDVLGPSMKFMAETSNIIGMYMGSKIAKRSLRFEVLSGISLRVVVMSVINILILIFLFPSYLEFSKNLLSQAGFEIINNDVALTYTLILVAIYNILNSILSITLSYLILETVKKRLTMFHINH